MDLDLTHPARTPADAATIKTLAHAHEQRRTEHRHTPVCGHFLPVTVAFWHQPFHWAALADGLSPEEAAALEDEFGRVLAGERDLLGRPCLCDRMGEARIHAVRGRGGNASWALEVTSIRVDLERAATLLPISWHGTRRVYLAQQRAAEYGQRFLRYRLNRSDRAQDQEPEPCAPGEPHRCTRWAYERMAATLGNAAPHCRWPRRQQERKETAA